MIFRDEGILVDNLCPISAQWRILSKHVNLRISCLLCLYNITFYLKTQLKLGFSKG